MSSVIDAILCRSASGTGACGDDFGGDWEVVWGMGSDAAMRR